MRAGDLAWGAAFGGLACFVWYELRRVATQEDLTDLSMRLDTTMRDYVRFGGALDELRGRVHALEETPISAAEHRADELEQRIALLEQRQQQLGAAPQGLRRR